VSNFRGSVHAAGLFCACPPVGAASAAMLWRYQQKPSRLKPLPQGSLRPWSPLAATMRWHAPGNSSTMHRLWACSSMVRAGDSSKGAAAA
jgi:hypothetical protein